MKQIIALITALLLAGNVYAQPAGTSVRVTSSALPVGASTESTLSTLNGKVTVCNTGAVTIASSILPTGGSTSVKQDTGNTSLSSIDGKIVTCNTGAVVVTSAPTTAVTGTFWQATQPVSGTFWQATQPVSGTVTANIGTAGTLATAAKQPALGTAGTASIDVLTVQGIASMTALKTDSSATTQPVSGTFWQATQPVSFAANQSVNVAQINGVVPTMGNGISGTGVQRVTLASDSTGQVTLATGANTIGALIANQSVNQTQVNGVAVTTGNGVAGTGVQRVAIASDNTAFSVNAAQSGTWTVQPGNTQNTTPWLIIQNAVTTGGYDKYSFGALVGAVQTVKGTAATLGGYYIFNPAATICYLQIFDVATATAVVLGTTVPDKSLGFPAGSAANIGAVRPGVNFVNGIKIAATTTRAGSVACGTGMDVNIDYK